MDLSKKYKELVETLIEHTGDNKIKWEEAPAKDQFYVHFKDVTIMIIKYNPDNYNITLLNKQGELITSIKDYEIQESDSSNNLLKDLYRLIKIQYFQVGKIIEDIIDEINSCSPGEYMKEDIRR